MATEERDSATHIRDPFRFLDLAAELRAQVYNELLLFKGAATCHPQILATCKQIHGEATSVLYGDNIIEIQIDEGHFWAQGRKCGWYESAYFTCEGRGARGTTWPAWLRRVERLRVSLDKGFRVFNTSARPRVRERPVARGWASDVQRMVYALCGFLAGDNRLRSVVLDFRHVRLVDSEMARSLLRWPLTMLPALAANILKTSDGETLDLAIKGPADGHGCGDCADPTVLDDAIALWEEALRYDQLVMESLIYDQRRRRCDDGFERAKDELGYLLDCEPSSMPSGSGRPRQR